MALASGQRDIDLTDLSRREWKTRRLARYTTYGMIVAFLSLFIVKGGPGWLYDWASGRGFPVGDAGLNILTVVVGLGLPVFGLVLLATSKPCPILMSIDSEAVAFRYKNGRADRWHWADPRLRFDLYDYHDLPEQHGTSRRDRLLRMDFDYCLRSRSDTFVTPLPREGFEALLEAARLHGLTIRSIKPPMHFAGRENPRAHVFRVRSSR